MPKVRLAPRNLSRSFTPFGGRWKKATRRVRTSRPARRRYRRRVARNTTSACIVINPGKPRVETVQKTVYNAWTEYTSVNTADDRDGVGMIAPSYQYFYYNVDPVGASTRHVRISLDTSTGVQTYETGKLTPANHAFPDFSSYAGLYQFYKVKWVKFTFTLTNRDTTDGSKFPVMFCRALYDVNTTSTFGNGLTAGTSAVDKMLEFSRVKRMQFNPDIPGGLTLTYKLYPRQYDSILQTFVKPRWHDFQTAASSSDRHYGLMTMFDDQLSNDANIAVHLEWCVAFKMRQ